MYSDDDGMEEYGGYGSMEEEEEDFEFGDEDEMMDIYERYGWLYCMVLLTAHAPASFRGGVAVGRSGHGAREVAHASSC